MNEEIELKLNLTEYLDVQVILDTLSSTFGCSNFKASNLRNIYLDSPDLELHKRQIAVRIRENSGGFIQTLKTKGSTSNGLYRRGEWEWSLEKPELSASLLQNCDAWFQEIDPAILAPIFETNFVRHSCCLKTLSSELEFAVDIGQVIAGDKRIAIREIEIELLQGDAAVIPEMGQKLCALLPLEHSDFSKAERGYSLLQPT